MTEPQEPVEAAEPTELPPEGVDDTAPEANAAETPAELEVDTFPRSYVTKLRNEMAHHRARAAETDRIAERAMTLALEVGTRGILQSALDLPPSDDFVGDDGLPSLERIRAAAEQLAADRPYLARARGDVGAGQRGEAEAPVSLLGMMRGD